MNKKKKISQAYLDFYGVVSEYQGPIEQNLPRRHPLRGKCEYVFEGDGGRWDPPLSVLLYELAADIRKLSPAYRRQLLNGWNLDAHLAMNRQQLTDAVTEGYPVTFLKLSASTRTNAGKPDARLTEEFDDHNYAVYVSIRAGTSKAEAMASLRRVVEKVEAEFETMIDSSAETVEAP